MKTQIRSGNLKASIELFADRVPQTVQKIRPLLPTTVPLCHAKFAGDELMFMIPAVIEPENFKSSIETGDVLYYPIQQTICLFFGDHIVPFGQGPFNVIGKIVDGDADLQQLAEIGLNTNLASRLEQACQPGEIYLSHISLALVKDEIPCEEVGTIEVKGFHYTIQTYRVLQHDVEMALES